MKTFKRKRLPDVQIIDLSTQIQDLDRKGDAPLFLAETDVAPDSSTEKSAKPTPPSPPPTPSRSRNILILVLVVAGAITAGVLGYRWWSFASTHQETDNAYVAGNINPINARISGTVVEVAVQDNQVVSPGAVLVKLDSGDAEVSLQQAKAALEVARAQATVAQANIGVVATNAQGETTQAQGNIDAAAATVSASESQVIEAQSGIPAAQAQLAQVEATLVKTKLDYNRYQTLVQEGAISQQQFETTKASYDATTAQRDATREQVRQAKAKLVQAQKNLNNSQAKLAATQGNLQQANATGKQTEVSRQQYKAAQAAVAQAEAQVKNAQLQSSYAVLTAPAQGQIGNKTVQVGQRVQPGQTLMSLVQQQHWVIANFKETQLAKMQAGQRVEIRIDAVPGRSFVGRIDSLSPASGAKFALLPPDNATGNFTKIVQRVPVKVLFDAKDLRGYESKITAGMSAAVTVEVPQK
jgi:membrane fusion protein, multidrug efflux system